MTNDQIFKYKLGNGEVCSKGVPLSTSKFWCLCLYVYNESLNVCECCHLRILQKREAGDLLTVKLRGIHRTDRICDRLNNDDLKCYTAKLVLFSWKPTHYCLSTVKVRPQMEYLRAARNSFKNISRAAGQVWTWCHLMC